MNYDKTKATYQGDLRSLVSDVNTIFYKDKPDYMLIGATMIGTKSGANGKNVSVCSLTFTANEDYDLSTLSIMIQKKHAPAF